MKWVPWVVATLLVISQVPSIAQLAGQTRPERLLEPPSRTAWFGTDRLGRDVLARTVVGANRSMMIALSATLCALAIGTVAGLIAAQYRRRLADRLLELAAAVTLATPFVLVSLAVAVLIPVSGLTLVIIVAVTTWGYAFRIVRGQTVLLQRATFVLAASSFGMPPSRITARYVVPNLAHVLLPQLFLGIGDVIAVESGLSFFGVGVRGAEPSIGAMIAESMSILPDGAWTFIFPAATLASIILMVQGGTLRTSN